MGPEQDMTKMKATKTFNQINLIKSFDFIFWIMDSMFKSLIIFVFAIFVYVIFL